jgi:hypothetical protein
VGTAGRAGGLQEAVSLAMKAAENAEGRRTEAAALLGPLEVAGPVPRTADLFDGFEAEDAPLPVTPVTRSPRAPGRPLGARNRSTEAWREYLLSRYRSPLVSCLEIAAKTPRQLAEEWGLYERVGAGEFAQDRLATGEAAKLILEALKVVAPYLHGKVPLEIKVPEGARGGVLVIGSLNVDMGVDGGAPHDQGPLIDVTSSEGARD